MAPSTVLVLRTLGDDSSFGPLICYFGQFNERPLLFLTPSQSVSQSQVGKTNTMLKGKSVRKHTTASQMVWEAELNQYTCLKSNKSCGLSDMESSNMFWSHKICGTLWGELLLLDLTSWLQVCPAKRFGGKTMRLENMPVYLRGKPDVMHFTSFTLLCQNSWLTVEPSFYQTRNERHQSTRA